MPAFRLSHLIFIVALSISSAAPALAAPDFLATFQTDLYAGRFPEAEAAAKARLAELPGDGQAQFGLGATQFLSAVEHLVQGLHRYGLRSTYKSDGLGILPILRLPIPDNPNPEPITYEAFRGLLSGFADDLGVADATLAGVRGPADLPLNIGNLRLDLDGDGQAGDSESLMRIIAVVTGTRFMETPFSSLDVAFDASDALWLRAYCNLLAAIADFPLGYDFREDYRVTFANVFPKGADFLPSKLPAAQAAMVARLTELGVTPTEYVPYPGHWSDYDTWVQTPEGQRYVEIQKLQSALRYGGIGGLLAFVPLMHWPVADAGRLKQVLVHLQAMIALSRESWRSILAERDDGGLAPSAVPSSTSSAESKASPLEPSASSPQAPGVVVESPPVAGHEWIPNPGQHGVFARMTITSDVVDGWMQLLDQFDGILAGRILVPHWRYLQGVNINKMLTQPEPFDPVLMIQGAGIESYLEDGQLADPGVWSRIIQVFGGNFLGYFLWIN